MNTTYKLLCARLQQLNDATGAAGTAVIDMSGMIYATSESLTPASTERIAEIHERCAAALHGHHLGHTAHVKLWHAEEAPLFAALSFAELYVLVAWWDVAYSPFAVHRQWEESLQEIERLLLALPPIPEGGGTSVARAVRRH